MPPAFPTRRSSDLNSLRYIVYFQGGPLDFLKPDERPVAGLWINDNGEILDRQLVKNDATGGWRVIMRVRRTDDSKPLEMRAVLRKGDENISETWAYILPPARSEEHTSEIQQLMRISYSVFCF